VFCSRAFQLTYRFVCARVEASYFIFKFQCDMSLASRADRVHTADVLVSPSASFANMGIKQPVIDGLRACGYVVPSPIQLLTIPVAVKGRDVLGISKSGTGKTVCFAVTSLQHVVQRLNTPQSLIVQPTRELATQTQCIIAAMASHLQDPVGVRAFVGGISIDLDTQILSQVQELVHVIVGTPGRLLALLQLGALVSSTIRVLILDEVDRLYSDSLASELSQILAFLPKKRQTLCFSATLPDGLEDSLQSIMSSPQLITVPSEDIKLIGVKQFYLRCEDVPAAESSKNDTQRRVSAIDFLLQQVDFHQAIVFCNSQSRAALVNDWLQVGGWSSTCIHGAMEQSDRSAAISAVKSFSARVLVSSDVTARGIDLDRVNLVVNCDLPLHAHTYLHRVGRTGRFGTLGLAVSVTNGDEDISSLSAISKSISYEIPQLPADIPKDWYATAPFLRCIIVTLQLGTIFSCKVMNVRVRNLQRPVRDQVMLHYLRNPGSVRSMVESMERRRGSVTEVDLFTLTA
jgi:ATP-dependent RNA helicase DDX20